GERRTAVAFAPAVALARGAPMAPVPGAHDRRRAAARRAADRRRRRHRSRPRAAARVLLQPPRAGGRRPARVDAPAPSPPRPAEGRGRRLRRRRAARPRHGGVPRRRDPPSPAAEGRRARPRRPAGGCSPFHRHAGAAGVPPGRGDLGHDQARRRLLPHVRARTEPEAVVLRVRRHERIAARDHGRHGSALQPRLQPTGDDGV
ncbi:MAG: hypothetical protein AVDCRST_MAG85-2684, partial [uncultured Solirubrobacteraceae bacterium]